MSQLQLWPTLALLFASSLMPGTVATAQPSDSNAIALYQMVVRSLNCDMGQILGGRLPDQLPVSLPLPDQMQIIGSVVRGPNDLKILLDVEQSPELVKSFYRKQLLKSGWNEQELFPEAESGFIHPMKFDRPLLFCSDSQGAELHIETKSAPNSLTEVHLNLQVLEPAGSYFCSQSSRVFETAPLPALNPPPDVKMSGVETRGLGATSTSSQALIETKLDLMALANHYANQFEKAGWRRRDGKQEGLWVWSTWSLKDKKGQTWRGRLSITQIGGLPNQPEQYMADAQVLQMEP